MHDDSGTFGPVQELCHQAELTKRTPALWLKSFGLRMPADDHRPKAQNDDREVKTYSRMPIERILFAILEGRRDFGVELPGHLRRWLEGIQARRTPLMNYGNETR